MTGSANGLLFVQSWLLAEETRLNRIITRPMLTFFILGDILGAGIYALTGQVAADAGGAIWSSFLLALVTTFAYLELVTKYPRAAGAACTSTGPSTSASSASWSPSPSWPPA